MGHKVVSSSDFEAKDLVKILAFEKDGVAKLCA